VRAQLGSDRAVESTNRTVTAEEHSKAELVKMAEDASIDTGGDKAILASRLSATTERRALPDPRVTTIEFPEGTTLAEAFVSIATGAGGGRGLWHYHSDGPATWVDSDSPGLAQLLSEHFGCPIGAPDDVEDTHWTPAGRPGVGPEDSA
jgi:hypothetical protein